MSLEVSIEIDLFNNFLFIYRLCMITLHDHSVGDNIYEVKSPIIQEKLTYE